LTSRDLPSESVFRSRQNNWLKTWFFSGEDNNVDTPQNRDPETSDAHGLQISKVKFEDLTKHFPDSQLSAEATLRKEIKEVRAQLDEVLRRLDAVTSGSGQAQQGKQRRKKKSGSSSSSSSD
jgi:hypothetical protein